MDILRLPTLVHNANKRAKEIEENPKLADIKQPKKLDDAYVTWILGIFGAHHFYLGNTEFGFAYLFTFGMAGVGWLVDFFRMPILVDRANEENPSPEKHLDDAYILTFPLGVLGLQHFHLGRTGWGIIYSLTFGLFGFGFLIDMIRMPYLVREVNEAIREQQKLVAVVVDNNVNTTRSFATSYQAISGDDIKKVPMNDNTASMPSPANFYHQLPPFNTKSDVPPPTYHSTC